jgi:methionyl-tRNA synthetase
MSKSLGTMVDPLEAADRLGADSLRWYLTREIVFGQDGDFSWDLFEKSYNADLANNLGNLVNRVTSMAHRYRGGVLKGPGSAPDTGVGTVHAQPLIYRTAMDRLDLSAGAASAISLVDAANEWIAAQEPWNLAKTGDEAALDAVLWNASEMLRQAAVLLSPFMPASSAEILRRLGVVHDLKTLRFEPGTTWQADGRRSLLQGALLWPRLEAPEPAVEVSTKEPTVTDPVNPVASPAASGAPALPPASAPVPASAWPMDARISIDDFMKVDLRVAHVLTAERVPNSKKLVKLSIDLGSEQRTIVAGIAEAYDAAALVGRHVVIVANLKPAKLMGIESNGMVLAASPDGGKPMLVAFDHPPAPGTRVR